MFHSTTLHMGVLGIVCLLTFAPSQLKAEMPPADDIQIEDSSYSTIGTIRSDGTIIDSSYSTLGYIDEDGSVENSSYSTIGYVDDGTIENSSYSTIGYVRDDGTLLDSSYSTIGYISTSGTISDSSYSTIAYADPDGEDVDAIAAFLFFFAPELLAQNAAPYSPDLIYPVNGQEGVATTVDFRFESTYDPDDDDLTYQLYLCAHDASGDCPFAADVQVFDATPALSGAGNTAPSLLVWVLLLSSIGLLLRRRRTVGWLVLATWLTTVGCLDEPLPWERSYDDDDWISVVGVPGPGYDGEEITVRVSGLEPGTGYTWWVVAADDEGEYTSSGAWSFVTQRATVAEPVDDE